MRVKFQQRDIDRDVWEMVEPGQSVDYAWEEPNMAHRLCVLLESENVKDNSEHEYNLDVIKVITRHPCLYSLMIVIPEKPLCGIAREGVRPLLAAK